MAIVSNTEENERWIRLCKEVEKSPSNRSDARTLHGEGMSELNEFMRSFAQLRLTLQDLEYGFRSVGSGGWGMVKARELRKSLEMLAFLYGSYLSAKHKDEPEILESVQYLNAGTESKLHHHCGHFASGHFSVFREVALSCSGLQGVLNDFLSMAYSERLMRRLTDMMGLFVKNARALEQYGRSDATQGRVRKIVEYTFKEVSSDMQDLREALVTFLENGVPSIRSAQQQVISRYLTMTTISTFFAGVNVTMLQYTYQNTNTRLGIAVNTLLFLSLVFSTVSAAQSLLVVDWLQSFTPSPDVGADLLSGIIMNGPLVALTLSKMQFSLALCLFLFSSKQNEDASIGICTLAGLLSFALCGLWMRLTYEYCEIHEFGDRHGFNLTLGSWRVAVFGRLFAALRSRESKTTHVGDGETDESTIVKFSRRSHSERSTPDHVPTRLPSHSPLPISEATTRPDDQEMIGNQLENHLDHPIATDDPQNTFNPSSSVQLSQPVGEDAANHGVRPEYTSQPRSSSTEEDRDEGIGRPDISLTSYPEAERRHREQRSMFSRRVGRSHVSAQNQISTPSKGTPPRPTETIPASGLSLEPQAPNSLHPMPAMEPLNLV